MPTDSTNRLVSLDAFRGFTIAGMILVNNPGDWKNVYAQLLHAKWHGWTFTDFIFPFFLFIGGVSMTLSLGKRAEAGADKLQLFTQLAKRAGIIFLIGFFLNFYPRFDLAHVRIPGVLQRIAFCVIAAAPVVIWGGVRSQIAAVLGLFAIYAVLMLFVPVPDASGDWSKAAAGVLEPGRDFGAYVDRMLLDGHLWVAAKTWDPEGLVSTLPAIGSQLLGVLAGQWLAANKTNAQKAGGMALAGIAAILLGLVLDAVFMPINKSLWTPSYTVLMTGWVLLIFSGFFWSLDVKPSAAATVAFKPFMIYGMNALFIFALSGLLAKTLSWIKITQPDGSQVSLSGLIWRSFVSLPLATIDASLLHAICFNSLMFAVAWFMWWKRWFVKV